MPALVPSFLARRCAGSKDCPKTANAMGSGKRLPFGCGGQAKNRTKESPHFHIIQIVRGLFPTRKVGLYFFRMLRCSHPGVSHPANR